MHRTKDFNVFSVVQLISQEVMMVEEISCLLSQAQLEQFTFWMGDDW